MLIIGLFVAAITWAVGSTVIWVIDIEKNKAAQKRDRRAIVDLQNLMNRQSKFDTKMVSTLLEENTGLRLALRKRRPGQLSKKGKVKR